MEKIPGFLIDAELSADGEGVVVGLTDEWTKSENGVALSTDLSPAEARAIAVFLVLLADKAETNMLNRMANTAGLS